ncbi:MAG: SDR family oxidoreductase [Bacilli bacterium]|jgi:3-oxoacyl-[acyl-carrier protein] reductase
MELNLKNKKVLIIGASKGIGEAITCEFAKEEANIVAVARTESLLKEVGCKCLQLSAASFNYLTADILNGDIKDITKTLIDNYGPFDIVIHNVGTSLVSRNIHGGYKDWNEALKINALAAIEMNSQLIPNMIKNDVAGHVIHVSSISATYLRGNPLYASSKAFLNAYVVTAGRELAPQGIVLSAVMPGAVAFCGSYWDNLIQENNPKVDDFLRHHQAIGRFGTPEEIASLVVFLASDKSSFMPGSIVPVDGGNM